MSNVFRNRNTSVSRPMTAAQRMILAQKSKDSATSSNERSHVGKNSTNTPASGLLAHIQSVVSSPPMPTQTQTVMHPYPSFDPSTQLRGGTQTDSSHNNPNVHQSHKQDHIHFSSAAEETYTYADASDQWSDTETLSSARSPRYNTVGYINEGQHPQDFATDSNPPPQHDEDPTHHGYLSDTRQDNQLVSTPTRRPINSALETPQPVPGPNMHLMAALRHQTHQLQPPNAQNMPPAAQSHPQQAATQHIPSPSSKLNFFYPAPADSPTSIQRQRLAAVLRSHAQTMNNVDNPHHQPQTLTQTHAQASVASHANTNPNGPSSAAHNTTSAPTTAPALSVAERLRQRATGRSVDTGAAHVAAASISAPALNANAPASHFTQPQPMHVHAAQVPPTAYEPAHCSTPQQARPATPQPTAQRPATPQHGRPVTPQQAAHRPPTPQRPLPSNRPSTPVRGQRAAHSQQPPQLHQQPQQPQQQQPQQQQPQQQQPLTSNPPSPPTPEPRRFPFPRTRPSTHPAAAARAHTVAAEPNAVALQGNISGGNMAHGNMPVQANIAPQARPASAVEYNVQDGTRVHQGVANTAAMGKSGGGQAAKSGYTVSAYGEQLLRAIYDPNAETNAANAVVDESGADPENYPQYDSGMMEYPEYSNPNAPAGVNPAAAASRQGQGTDSAIPVVPGFARNINTDVSVHNNVAVDTGSFTQRLQVPAVNMTMGNLWRELEQDNRQLNALNKEFMQRMEALEKSLQEKIHELGVSTAKVEALQGTLQEERRLSAMMKEEKVQFMTAIKDQAGLLGQSRDALQMLQTGMTAVKSRLETVTGEKDRLQEDFDRLRSELKNSEKEKRVLQGKLDKAHENIAALESTQAELEGHVKVLKQAEKTKSRQLSTAVLEKRRYVEAFDRVLLFVKSKHIPSTAGEGGLRLQKVLLELLRVDDGGDRDKDSGESGGKTKVRDAGDGSREAFMRRLREEVEEQEREKARKKDKETDLLALLQLNKDTARVPRNNALSGANFGNSGSGKDTKSKLNLRERMQEQAEYISSLESTVRTLREQNLTLTQRFRVAVAERKKLQAMVRRMEQKTHYPEEDVGNYEDYENFPDQRPDEDRHTNDARHAYDEQESAYQYDAVYPTEAEQDEGHVDYVDDQRNNVSYLGNSVAFEENNQNINDSVSFLLHPSSTRKRNAIASNATDAHNVNLTNTYLDPQLQGDVVVDRENQGDMDVSGHHGGNYSAWDDANVSTSEMAQWRNYENHTHTNGAISTTTERHDGQFHASQLDEIDADYHALLSVASHNQTNYNPNIYDMNSQVSGLRPDVRNDHISGFTSNSHSTAANAPMGASDGDTATARALAELNRSLALLQGNRESSDMPSRGGGAGAGAGAGAGVVAGGYGDYSAYLRSVEPNVFGEGRNDELNGTDIVQKDAFSGATGVNNPLLAHLYGDATNSIGASTGLRSNPFYKPRQ